MAEHSVEYILWVNWANCMSWHDWRRLTQIGVNKRWYYIFSLIVRWYVFNPEAFLSCLFLSSHLSKSWGYDQLCCPSICLKNHGGPTIWDVDICPGFSHRNKESPCRWTTAVHWIHTSPSCIGSDIRTSRPWTSLRLKIPRRLHVSGVSWRLDPGWRSRMTWSLVFWWASPTNRKTEIPRCEIGYETLLFTDYAYSSTAKRSES